MINKKPKVTIGMPAYNRSEIIAETIEYVLRQTYKNFELIIFNDGSVDNTSEVINKFNDERIIYIDSKVNLGPPHPLNKILDLARGEYIIILHDHDIFDEKLIELSVSALEKNTDIGFVLQGSNWIDENNIIYENKNTFSIINNGKKAGIQLLNNENFSSNFHACSMVRRTALNEAGYYYDSKFGLYSDIDLWLRLLYVYNFYYIKDKLLTFRIRESNNHFLSKKLFEVNEILYLINLKNLELYNINNKNMLLKAKKKYRNLNIKTLIKYATEKDKDM
jgi:glycosyltransferase involved in cell wall biosynthesis